MKRIVTMLFCLLLLTAFSSVAYAYSGSNYTSISSLATKIDNLIQGQVAVFSNTSAKFKVGSSINNSTTYKWKSGGYSGKQCYAYGNAAYYYLFGDVPYHGGGGYSNSHLILGVKCHNSLSYDKLFNAGVGCGAYIRTTDKSNGEYNGNTGHSMIILAYNSSTITVLHGNADGNGLVTITEYTWGNFNKKQLSGRGRYISHIVQPNLTAGQTNVSSEFPTIIDATAPKSLSNGTRFPLKGTITCKYNITEVRGMVYNCTAGTKIFDVPVNPNSTSYTLGTSGEAINDGLLFDDSRLNNSWCRYVLKVTYDKNGTSCVKYMFDRYFTVGSAASMTLQEPGFFEFVCDDETRTGPSEADTLAQSCAKGTIVYATGYTLNSANNMWLKLSDGNYVWSGDVSRVTQSGSSALVEEIHISTPEGVEDQDEEYFGYEDDSKTIVLQAYAMPFDAIKTDVEWTISDPSILRLDSTEKPYDGLTIGYFTIIGVGQTNVTAAAADGSNVSRTIRVGYYISSLTMPTSNVSLSVGDTWQACPTIVPSIAKYSDLNWTSSNPQVASVDANGVVTAVSGGSATITALPKLPVNSDYVSPVSCTITVASAPILCFSNICYPDPYKISTSGYVWRDGSGTITARDGLASVVFNIYDTHGNRVAHYENNQNVTALTLKSITSNIKMSALTVEGYSTFEVIATDVNGHVLKASVQFIASTTQTMSTKAFNRTYAEPTLLAVASHENSNYYLYRASYTWENAKSFAQSQGGHLATITSSSENAVIYEMLSSRNIDFAWLGGYHNGSGYVWVTGEDMSYTNWAANEPNMRASVEKNMEMYGVGSEAGQWNDVESNRNLRNHFIVEIPIHATSGSCGENATWTFLNNVLTISGTGAMEDYDSFLETPWYHYREDIYQIVINNGINSIGSCAFDNIINLESVIVIPDSVTRIGDCAFDACEVIIPDSVLQIGTCSAFGCYFRVDANNPNYSSVDGTLYNKNKTKLIKCNPWAESITIPNSVTNICEAAFAYCRYITAISIPNSVTVIGNHTFEECTDLTSVTIPNSVTAIGDCAFLYCSKLESISIPDSTTLIGNYAFWNCNNLASIVIPSSVTSIGQDVFYHCDGLVISCYDGSVAHDYAINNYIDYTLLDTPLNHPDFVVPFALTTIESEAFTNISAKRVKLAENVTKIGNKAFAYCSNLVGIYIPENCNTIAADAFEGVTGLTIYGREGSYAEFYAGKRGFVFVKVE